METQRERTIRRRRYRRRNRLIMTAVIVGVLAVLIAIAVLIGMLLTPPAGSTGETDGTTAATTTTVPTTTTTRYPVISTGMLPNLGLDTNEIQVVMLYDATNNQVVYQYDGARRMYPASLTKMITAAVACDYMTDGITYTVGSEIALMESDASSAGLWQGEPVTLRELCEGLLMNSGGDAAYTLAVNTARIAADNRDLSDTDAVKAFMDLVNRKLQELGCTGSHFSTPDGYYAYDHYTTAEDLVKIALYARSKPMLADIMSKSSGQFYKSNTNELVNAASEHYYPYADGMKTGFHNEGGYCLAASATKNGTSLIAVILCSHDADERFTVAKNLLEQGFAYVAEKTAAS